MKLGKQADIRRSAHGDANPSGNRCFRCRYPHEIWRKVGDGTAYFQAKAVQLAHMNTILVEGCCYTRGKVAELVWQACCLPSLFLGDLHLAATRLNCASLLLAKS